MQGFSHIIKNPEGLHARPAGAIIKCASGFGCTIDISCKGKQASLKGGIFGLMGLGLRCGDAIEIRCDGEGEAEAVAALKKLAEELL